MNNVANRAKGGIETAVLINKSDIDLTTFNTIWCNSNKCYFIRQNWF
jgi:hypothetical protein